MLNGLRLLPVVMLAALLLAGLRLGEAWHNVAYASEEKKADTHAAAEPHDANASTAPETPPPPAPQMPNLYSNSELDVLQALAERREQLDAREDSIKQKEAVFAATEMRLDEKIKELEALKADIQKTRDTIKEMVGMLDKKEEEKLTSMVKVFESMKPKEAASIFNNMDLPVLLPVIGRMKEAKTAPILAQMNPKKATEVASILASPTRIPPDLLDKVE